MHALQLIQPVFQRLLLIDQPFTLGVGRVLREPFIRQGLLHLGQATTQVVHLLYQLQRFFVLVPPDIRHMRTDIPPGPLHGRVGRVLPDHQRGRRFFHTRTELVRDTPLRVHCLGDPQQGRLSQGSWQRRGAKVQVPITVQVAQLLHPAGCKHLHIEAGRGRIPLGVYQYPRQRPMVTVSYLFGDHRSLNQGFVGQPLTIDIHLIRQEPQLVQLAVDLGILPFSHLPFQPGQGTAGNLAHIPRGRGPFAFFGRTGSLFQTVRVIPYRHAHGGLTFVARLQLVAKALFIRPQFAFIHAGDRRQVNAGRFAQFRQRLTRVCGTAGIVVFGFRLIQRLRGITKRPLADRPVHVRGTTGGPGVGVFVARVEFGRTDFPLHPLRALDAIVHLAVGVFHRLLHIGFRLADNTLPCGTTFFRRQGLRLLHLAGDPLLQDLRFVNIT